MDFDDSDGSESSKSIYSLNSRATKFVYNILVKICYSNHRDVAQ